MLNTTFEVAAGSIVGHVHLGQNGLLRGQNNQDAYGFFQIPSGIALAVCDGCSAHPYSELGARLGCDEVLACVRSALERNVFGAPGVDSAFVLERIRQDVLSQLRVMALRLSRGGSFTELVESRLLFTCLVGIISPAVTVVAAIGDGYYSFGEEVVRIGPFPENKPPYLAYGLIDTEFSSQPEMLKFQVVAERATADLQTLLIASDGFGKLIEAADRNVPGFSDKVGSISQFWTEDSYYRNRDAIRRKLALMNSERVLLARGGNELVRHRPLLEDDTSLVVARRVVTGKDNAHAT